MAVSIDMSRGGGHRCKRALAAAVVIGNSTTARERFYVPECESITARAIVTTVTSDPVLRIFPQEADIGFDDADVDDAASGLTAETTLSADTEATHTYTLLGEPYVDVTIACDSGDAATITTVDVFVKRSP